MNSRHVLNIIKLKAKLSGTGTVRVFVERTRDRARKQIGFPIPAFLRKEQLSREPGVEAGCQI